MITDPSQDFTDHVYPAIGTFLSIQNGIVLMYFKAVKYSLNGSDKEFLLRVFSSSEEEAVRTVLADGYEILEQWHFHQELDRMQGDVLKVAGISVIVKENPDARSD